MQGGSSHLQGQSAHPVRELPDQLWNSFWSSRQYITLAPIFWQFIQCETCKRSKGSPLLSSPPPGDGTPGYCRLVLAKPKAAKKGERADPSTSYMVRASFGRQLHQAALHSPTPTSPASTSSQCTHPLETSNKLIFLISDLYPITPTHVKVNNSM